MVETSPCVALLFCFPLLLIAPTNPIVNILADAISNPVLLLSNKRYRRVKTGNARFSYFSLFSIFQKQPTSFPENFNLKLLFPWSTSSDTYCKPLLSNKRFQNNQTLYWKKSTRSSNIHFGNMLLHTGQLFSPHPILPLSAKQQFQLLWCFLNKGLQQGAAQQAICFFASSTGVLLQVSNDYLNGEL